MGVLIVGAGLAGLVSAMRIKQLHPDTDVTVMEKRKPEGNTQISGLRIREKEITRLMALGNGGELRNEMVRFGEIGLSELEYWKGVLPYTQSLDWFGPQFFNGIGTRMLLGLHALARESGVNFIEGEAKKIINEGGHIGGVRTNHEVIRASEIILANGTASGNMFISTNRPIGNSAHVLAYEAGIPLIDGTINMFHPFGKCDKNGNPKLGCYETDKLAGAEVFFADGRKSKEVTDMLLNHAAHNHFSEIAREFIANGSVVRLLFPGGEENFARVSHHYSHMGIKTDDGVKVSGIDNLMAIGDASNLGFWSNHNRRFPGFALLKCLVDGLLVAHRVGEMPQDARVSPIERESDTDRESIEDEDIFPEALKRLNTTMLFEINFGEGSRRGQAAESWVKESAHLARDSGNTIVKLSHDLAKVHVIKFKNPEMTEPIPVVKGPLIRDAELARQKRYL